MSNKKQNFPNSQHVDNAEVSAQFTKAAQIDDELGPVLDAQGNPIAADAEAATPVLILDILDNSTSRRYKVKIDKGNLRTHHGKSYGMAMYRLALKSGFSDAEASNLGEVARDDERFVKMIELQTSSASLRHVVADAAAAAFVKWNAPHPAPTAAELATKGGVYDAFVEAFQPVFLDSANG